MVTSVVELQASPMRGTCPATSAPVASADRPLLYFGHGTNDCAAAHRNGWTYVLVVAGALVVKNFAASHLVPAPALVIVRPGGPVTWQLGDAESCRVAAWTWRQPLRDEITRLAPAGFAAHPLSVADLACLRQLHALCRTEVFRNDPRSAAALGGIQLVLETHIARIWQGEVSDPRREMVERALTWIRGHFSARQPLAELADFLGVSTATVQRLFRQYLGTTVMKKVSEQRRFEAERMLLARTASVKEIAFHLGYRHPHDFTRAFRKSTGSVPSRQLLKAG